MANKKRRKSSSYDNGGFDMKSLGALLVIIIGIAVIILLVKTANGENTVAENNSGTPNASVNSDVVNEENNDVDSDSTTTTTASTEGTTTTTEAKFTVTVEDLDGTYNRTNVESDNAAKLKVSNQDEEGFDFSLSLPDTKYAGYAVFVGETTAQWEYDGNVLEFKCASDSVTISGFKAANGKYISGEPTYTDEPESDYDAGIINASSTRSKMSDIMSSDDYALLKKLLNEGSRMGMSQNNSEYQTDKNGEGIMVDKETGMIKYQYELKYEGKCMVLCSSDGEVCVGIYNENDDTGQLRVYASTSALRSNVPSCIEKYAVAYDLELVAG